MRLTQIIIGVLLALTFVGGMAGCDNANAPSTPDVATDNGYVGETEPVEEEVDYLAIVHSAITGAAGIAMTSQAQAITNENFAACVATGAVVSTLGVAGDAVQSARDSMPTIPSVELSLGVCETVENTLDGAKVPDVVGLYVNAGLNSVESLLGVSKAKIEAANCDAYGWLTASLDYLQGAVNPVVTFISDPSAPLLIPSVTADLSACGG